jgi:hypothetical protein
MKLSEYNELLNTWFKTRNMQSLDPKNQLLKTFEEYGELIEGVECCNIDETIDAIGDIYVCLIGLQIQLKQPLWINSDYKRSNGITPLMQQLCSLANQFSRGYNGTEIGVTLAFGYLEGVASKFNLDIEDCVGCAWEEIKDRKGLVIDGIFIKYNDLSEQDQAVVDMTQEAMF